MRHLTSCFFYFFGNISNVLGFLFFSSKNAEHSTNMSNTWFVLFKVIVWKFCHHLLTITMCQTCMTFFCGKQKKIFWRILGTTDFHYMGKSKTNKQTNKNKNQPHNMLLWVQKWWQSCNFWVHCYFKAHIYVVRSTGSPHRPLMLVLLSCL